MNVRQYDKLPLWVEFLTFIPSVCAHQCFVSLYFCLLLSHNEVLQSRNDSNCSTSVYWFILIAHFILENWFFFFFIKLWFTWREKKSSAEKLIFLCKCCNCTYCSCVMLYDWIGLLWFSLNVSRGKNRGFQNVASVHLWFGEQEATQTWRRSTERNAKLWIGKGILLNLWFKQI